MRYKCSRCHFTKEGMTPLCDHCGQTTHRVMNEVKSHVSFPGSKSLVEVMQREEHNQIVESRV